VVERDRLMTEASETRPGGMLAVIGADPLEVVNVTQAVEGIVVVANFNSPRQTVLSGERGALEDAANLLAMRKIWLNVKGAFHSPLMVEASQAMATVLNEVRFEDPKIPMVSGAHGEVLAVAEDVRRALQNQMLSPVKWVAVIERFVALDVKEIVEVPGRTLIRMLKDFENLPLVGLSAEEVRA